MEGERQNDPNKGLSSPETGDQQKERAFNWQDKGMRGLLFTHIKPADIVVGFSSLEEVDEFASRMGDFLLGKAARARHRDLRETVNHVISKNKKGSLLSDVLRPKGFIGELKDPRIVIIPPNLGFVATRKEEIRQEEARSFVVAVDMHSTGRGIVGRSGRVCTVYVREGQYYLTAAKSTKKVVSTKGDRFAQLLQAESASAHHTNVLRSLKRVASAGLPTLGKR